MKTEHLWGGGIKIPSIITANSKKYNMPQERVFNPQVLYIICHTT